MSEDLHLRRIAVALLASMLVIAASLLAHFKLYWPAGGVFFIAMALLVFAPLLTGDFDVEQADWDVDTGGDQS